MTLYMLLDDGGRTIETSFSVGDLIADVKAYFLARPWSDRVFHILEFETSGSVAEWTAEDFKDGE